MVSVNYNISLYKWSYIASKSVGRHNRIFIRLCKKNSIFKTFNSFHWYKRGSAFQNAAHAPPQFGSIFHKMKVQRKTALTTT